MELKGGGRAPPTPTRLHGVILTVMMECMPESGHFHSVCTLYSPLNTVTLATARWKNKESILNSTTSLTKVKMQQVSVSSCSLPSEVLILRALVYNYGHWGEQGAGRGGGVAGFNDETLSEMSICKTQF
jgi:hypothetical protein